MGFIIAREQWDYEIGGSQKCPVKRISYAICVPAFLVIIAREHSDYESEGVLKVFRGEDPIIELRFKQNLENRT